MKTFFYYMIIVPFGFCSHRRTLFEGKNSTFAISFSPLINYLRKKPYLIKKKCISPLVSFYFFYWLYFLDPICIYQIYKKERGRMSEKCENHMAVFFQLEFLMELTCFES